MSDVRSRLRKWVYEQLELQDEIELPTLASEALNLFSQDKAFIKAFADEMLPRMVYEIVSDIMSRARSNNRIRLGDTLTDLEGVKQRARKHSLFLNWYEHAGDKSIRLMEMRREDLLTAAIEREQRGTTELLIAKQLRNIANFLEGGQKVSDRFSIEEVEHLMSESDVLAITT